MVCFYLGARLRPEYYYALSPNQRKHIGSVFIDENFSDVHIAASAFLCAIHRILRFRREGRMDEVEEWGQMAVSLARSGSEMLGNLEYPLSSRIGAGIDLRLGYVSCARPTTDRGLMFRYCPMIRLAHSFCMRCPA